MIVLIVQSRDCYLCSFFVIIPPDPWFKTAFSLSKVMHYESVSVYYDT
jgi:hypothetical protein